MSVLSLVERLAEDIRKFCRTVVDRRTERKQNFYKSRFAILFSRLVWPSSMGSFLLLEASMEQLT